MIDVVVHQLEIKGVEDPDLYIADPLIRWRNTEAGQYIMKHSNPAPMWHRMFNPATYVYTYIVIATLKEEDYTFWSLKYK